MGQTGGWPGAQKVPKSGYRAHLGLQPEADFQAQTTGTSQTEHRTRTNPGTAKGSPQQLINSTDQFPTPFPSKCGGRQPLAAHFRCSRNPLPLVSPQTQGLLQIGRPQQRGDIPPKKAQEDCGFRLVTPSLRAHAHTVHCTMESPAARTRGGPQQRAYKEWRPNDRGVLGCPPPQARRALRWQLHWPTPS